MTEEKLQNIEITLAYHDIQLHDLSEMIEVQWKEIERLKIQLEKAHAKINDIETTDNDGKPMSVSDLAASEKPPHY